MNHDAESADLTIAAAAAVELEDVETFCVAMATDQYGEQFGLSFEVPISGEYDEQDRRLGMDTYSISDQLGRTIYGGILAIEADAGTSVLTLHLSEEATNTLHIPGTLRFHLPSLKFNEVVGGFRRVLAADELGRSIP